ncbi:MAG TPA: hypothetical protein VD772_09725, partial [Anseongella sp.]|nr:hypothetical protein [Anseongella sp.]
VSLKHNSRFASYCLINKGNYLYELDIPLPFTFIFNDESRARLCLMPAYWFMYNVYALARNAWKYKTRDRRIRKTQAIEYDYLAPDTANEMFQALRLLEKWVSLAWLEQEGRDPEALTEEQVQELGKDLLLRQPEAVQSLTVKAYGVENSKREVVLVKVEQAYKWYTEMLHHYGVSTLLEHFQEDAPLDLAALPGKFRFRDRGNWINAGGQLIHQADLEQLKADIKQGAIGSWNGVHERYAELSRLYETDKLNHAWLTLLEINGIDERELAESWPALLARSVETMQKLADGAYSSREKDYKNPFRQMLYENMSEMEAVTGKLEDNDFVQLMQSAADAYREKAGKLLQQNSYTNL